MAGSVLDVLRFALDHPNITLCTGCTVTAIRVKEHTFTIRTEAELFTADAVILAAGGAAGSKLGGGMDGYQLAKSLGHHRTALYPSLVQLKTDPTYPRSLKGVKAQALRDEDYVETVFTASTHDYILFFTNTGKAYRKKGYLIPEAGRAARGTNIVNILPLEPGEKVNVMLHFRETDEESFLFFATRNGTVKRMPVLALKNIRQSGIRALNLDEGDALINVMGTTGEQNILIATRDGQAICFAETDVRPMGRQAVGVRGISLREGDEVIGAEIATPGMYVLSITENGYGKRTPMEEYLRGDDVQRRGGKGRRNHNITDKTGPVTAMKLVSGEEDVLSVSDDGTMIRMAADGISITGRATQGVRVMRLAEGSKVISVALTERAEDAETEAPAEAESAPET
jgi:DNA gyrase subunit A